MKLKVYSVYLDDSYGVYKFTIPAVSEKAARKYVEGNGEVIAVKDSDLQDIDLDCLINSLRSTGWGQAEIDVITRTLQLVGLDREQ